MHNETWGLVHSTVMCKNPEMDNADLEVPETWLEKFFGTQIGGAIGVASVVLTFLVTGLVFLGCWAYAIDQYGWFLGGTLGWIPSAIISVITFAIVQLVSPVFIILIALGIIGPITWYVLR